MTMIRLRHGHWATQSPGAPERRHRAGAVTSRIVAESESRRRIPSPHWQASSRFRVTVHAACARPEPAAAAGGPGQRLVRASGPARDTQAIALHRRIVPPRPVSRAAPGHWMQYNCQYWGESGTFPLTKSTEFIEVCSARPQVKTKIFHF